MSNGDKLRGAAADGIDLRGPLFIAEHRAKVCEILGVADIADAPLIERVRLLEAACLAHHAALRGMLDALGALLDAMPAAVTEMVKEDLAIFPRVGAKS